MLEKNFFSKRVLFFTKGYLFFFSFFFYLFVFVLLFLFLFFFFLKNGNDEAREVSEEVEGGL